MKAVAKAADAADAMVDCGMNSPSIPVFDRGYMGTGGRGGNPWKSPGK
jgi:hypothetical protein